MDEPTTVLVADLYYIEGYAKFLAEKARAGTLTKADYAVAQRMMELAGKACGTVAVKTGPW